MSLCGLYTYSLTNGQNGVVQHDRGGAYNVQGSSADQGESVGKKLCDSTGAAPNYVAVATVHIKVTSDLIVH